jgi:hypothetical protein
MNLNKTTQTLLLATAIAGSLDLALAIGFNAYYGVALHVVPQVIASGLLGVTSFKGGAATVGLGVALHYAIMLVIAGVYWAASRRLKFLARDPVQWGPLYGVIVYLAMTYVVVPLSAYHPAPPTAAWVIADLVSHLFFVGLPIALVVKRYSS